MDSVKKVGRTESLLSWTLDGGIGTGLLRRSWKGFECQYCAHMITMRRWGKRMQSSIEIRTDGSLAPPAFPTKSTAEENDSDGENSDRVMGHEKAIHHFAFFSLGLLSRATTRIPPPLSTYASKQKKTQACRVGDHGQAQEWEGRTRRLNRSRLSDRSLKPAKRREHVFSENSGEK